MFKNAIKHTIKAHSNMLKFLCGCFQGTPTVELNVQERADVKEAQPLIQLISTIISYGADDRK